MLMNAAGMNSGSYASLLQKHPNKKLVRISELRSDEIMEGAAVAIPLSAVEEVSARFENTLYGYFIGNRLAFPLVENYTKNTWASSALRKEEIKKAPVWVKMHHVPIAAYSEVGLSLIITQIGCPIMLDSYTSNMCVRSWGKNKYARALIEVSVDRDLMESIVITIPLGKGKGHTLATIEIEYEWKPPVCSICKIFDHTNDKCPKHPKVLTTKVKDNDEFIEPIKEVEEVNVHDKSCDQESVVHKDNDMMLKNKFAVLNDDVENGGARVYEPSHNNIVNTSDSEEVDEEIFIEDDRRKQVDSMRASTPNDTDSNLVRLCSSVFRHWEWTSNGVACTKGSRIIMGWNQNERQSLWSNLDLHKLYVRNRSWCLMGDFNAALFLDDLATGSSNIDISMWEFKACVENIEVIDIQQVGLKFTWNQKPKGKDGILKKLDRVLTNLEFNDLFQGVHAIFQLYRISDHSPVVLKIPWQVVKIHVSQSRIDVVSNSDGVLFENDHVLEAFVAHYEAFLGHLGTVFVLNVTDLFVTSLDVNNANDMIRMVSVTEIKNAMFSMGNEKSPGPDGFTAAFFKEAWDIVGKDVILVVRKFFINGKLLKELNHTIITLIPKVSTPARKAYDTVDWSFLRMILVGFGFHERMVGWIMECVTTTSFSICVNGSLQGYFKGKRDLRQGDLLSP
nr:hypothetical protein [Tanacetum cinerariifolium]